MPDSCALLPTSSTGLCRNIAQDCQLPRHSSTLHITNAKCFEGTVLLCFHCKSRGTPQDTTALQQERAAGLRCVQVTENQRFLQHDSAFATPTQAAGSDRSSFMLLIPPLHAWFHPLLTCHSEAWTSHHLSMAQTSLAELMLLDPEEKEERSASCSSLWGTHISQYFLPSFCNFLFFNKL